MDKEKRNHLLKIIMVAVPAVVMYFIYHSIRYPGVDGVPMDPLPTEWWAFAWFVLVLAIAVFGAWIVPRERKAWIAFLFVPFGLFMMRYGVSLGWWMLAVLVGWMLAVTLAARYWPRQAP